MSLTCMVPVRPQVHTNQTLQLEMQRMQAHNSRVYANVMRAVSTHMADRICAFR